MIFDILYVKGPKGEECNLLNVKLKDRKMVLKRVIKNIKQKFEVVTGHETTNVDDIFREFDKAMMRNEEGIIIKQLDSIYLPNDRGTSWIKLKGEYMEGMTDTLDLLIIGGYFGEGRVRIGVRNHDIELVFLISCTGGRLDRASDTFPFGSREINRRKKPRKISFSSFL